jgi:pyridinium-3,5-bisthiocarboxylic acid mononucleotide nickel chelatase
MASAPRWRRPGSRAGSAAPDEHDDVSTAAWIDASAGAAGDMLLGALIDAGADQAAVRSAVARLSAATGDKVTVQVTSVRRHGLRAARAEVQAGPSQVHRGLADVLELIKAASLPGSAAEFAGRVFGLLASAEAEVHGVPADRIAFHEVGALDSLADIIGTAVALDSLGLLASDAGVTVSSVGLGSGSVVTAHGPLPVPVPAVVRLLADAGAPASAGPGEGELCTPTGAALLAALAAGWGPMPPLIVRSAGAGAGSRDPASHANIVRVLVGVSAGQAPVLESSALRLVESTIDDLDPRLWPDALDALQTAGAIDCWLTPVLMRTGRPGQVVTALTQADTQDSVVHALLRVTTTLGVRVSEVSRLALPRDQIEVQVRGQPVRVKRGWLDGAAVTVQPEFADARAAADALGIPIADVLDVARQAARELP